MIVHDEGCYGEVFASYQAHASFFPLIGAVLLGEQDGTVLVDDPVQPTAVYIEHAFGFAQIFGMPSSAFESALERYLLVERPFSPHKIRLYTPYLPGFFGDATWDSLKSVRQRFVIDPACRGLSQPSEYPADWGVKVVVVDEGHVEEIEQVFGVVKRFWRSPEDFARKANAVVVWCRGQMAAICYAAAEADRRVEIDVLTLTEFRTLGLGKLAVNRFIEVCRDASLEPLWDCFTNNLGSMRLAETLGFRAKYSPYSFYTISK
jgi:GNAT superfamily N-acetyltransferase